MIKAPISLQDLRRRIYREAKADKAKRFWGMFVHVAKFETLAEAYRMAKQNDGAPGVDGVTFDEIEAQGVSVFLTGIREQLLSGNYRPTRTREVRIPKGNGKFRTLSIPTIRDRVVEGALKLILEAVFEADFQDGSYGYRPKRAAHDAIARVADAVIRNHTRVIDVDLKDYFGSIRQDLLLKKVAKRIDDDRVMSLLKLILKKSGKQGIAQGGPLSPLLSNLYLTEVDEMLEKAKSYSYRRDGYYHVEYARFADGTPVQASNLWGASPLTPIVRSGV
jgi:RNA-directed DNA polymerase